MSIIRRPTFDAPGRIARSQTGQSTLSRQPTLSEALTQTLIDDTELSESEQHNLAVENIRSFYKTWVLVDGYVFLVYARQAWIHRSIVSPTEMSDGVVAISFAVDLVTALTALRSLRDHHAECVDTSASWWKSKHAVVFATAASNTISLLLSAGCRYIHSLSEGTTQTLTLMYVLFKAFKLRPLWTLEKQLNDIETCLPEFFKMWGVKQDDKTSHRMGLVLLFCVVALVSLYLIALTMDDLQSHPVAAAWLPVVNHGAAGLPLDLIARQNTTDLLPTGWNSATLELSRSDDFANGATGGLTVGCAVATAAGPELTPVGCAIGSVLGGIGGLIGR